MPVGTLVAGGTALTVAVKLTFEPGKDGFGADVTSVVVEMGATITRLIWLVMLSSIATSPGTGDSAQEDGRWVEGAGLDAGVIEEAISAPTQRGRPQDGDGNDVVVQRQVACHDDQVVGPAANRQGIGQLEVIGHARGQAQVVQEGECPGTVAWLEPGQPRRGDVAVYSPAAFESLVARCAQNKTTCNRRDIERRAGGDINDRAVGNGSPRRLTPAFPG